MVNEVTGHSTLLITALAGLYGLFIGSALNAVVWRLYVGRSWVKGRSMCPDCKHVLAARDLVPVFSWLALRGRCRYCRAKIHWQYPVVELLTAVLFALSAWRLDPVTGLDWAQLVLWLGVLSMLIVLAVYDLRWMLLPDRVMLPTAILAAALLAVEVGQTGSWTSLRGPISAAILAGGGFFALAVFSRGRAMGGGDIKLAVVMGLLLGLRGTALAMLIAFNVAAIVGITLIATGRKRRRDQIPFGPFLVGATIYAYLYGGSIIHWYLSSNGLT